MRRNSGRWEDARTQSWTDTARWKSRRWQEDSAAAGPQAWSGEDWGRESFRKKRKEDAAAGRQQESRWEDCWRSEGVTRNWIASTACAAAADSLARDHLEPEAGEQEHSAKSGSQELGKAKPKLVLVPRKPPAQAAALDDGSAAKLPSDHRHASSLDAGAYVTSPAKVGAMVSKHGFAILHGVLSPDACARMRRRCESILEDMRSVDREGVGNRGQGRYSMGAASQSGQQLHHSEWAELLAEPVLDGLDSIYGPNQYFLRGGGGEIVLGGVDEYQDLHADISSQSKDCDGVDRPPLLVVNFAVQAIAEDFGPTRIWPARGRPRDSTKPPPHREEPPHVLRSVLAPLPEGSCVLRDARIWHGGTPNYKDRPRFLPNLEFFSREHMQQMTAKAQGKGKSRLYTFQTMPPRVFEQLTPRAQKLAQALVASGEVASGVKRDFARAQGKLFEQQVEAKLFALGEGKTARLMGNPFEGHVISNIARAKGFDCKIERDGRRIVALVTRRGP